MDSNITIFQSEELTPARRRIRILCCIAGIFIVLTFLACGIRYWIDSRKPDPKDETKALKFLASDHFKKLPKSERKLFVREMGRPNRQAMHALSPADRRKAFQNMRQIREAEMNERLAKFFQMSKAEQNAQLDEDIARMAERRKQMEERRKNAQGGQRGQRGQNAAGGQRRGNGPSAAEKRQREASRNPGSGAQRQVYFQLMRNRQTKK